MNANHPLNSRMSSRKLLNQTVFTAAGLLLLTSAFLAPSAQAKVKESPAAPPVTQTGGSTSSGGSTSQTSTSSSVSDTPGSITFNATPKTGDDSQVKVTLDNTSNPGKITVKVDVIPYGPDKIIGDINGVFLNLPSGVGTLQIGSVAGGPVNTGESKQGTGINDLNDGVNMNGGSGYSSFNLGVRIGVSGGINGGDDYQTTTFTLSDPNGKLTLASLTGLDIGVRLKSVGPADGTRNGSSKIGESVGTVVAETPSGGGETPGGGGETPGGGGETPGGGGETPGGGGETPGGETPGGGPVEQVPEPTTMGGLALGFGALMKWRSQRKNAKK